MNHIVRLPFVSRRQGLQLLASGLAVRFFVDLSLPLGALSPWRAVGNETDMIEPLIGLAMR